MKVFCYLKDINMYNFIYFINFIMYVLKNYMSVYVNVDK